MNGFDYCYCIYDTFYIYFFDALKIKNILFVFCLFGVEMGGLKRVG
jgi:hypothetical protein